VLKKSARSIPIPWICWAPFENLTALIGVIGLGYVGMAHRNSLRQLARNYLASACLAAALVWWG
jgi:hypothetical protein